MRRIKETLKMQATIHNEFLTLTVDTHGAEAVSLKNAAGEELLWQADPAVWKRHAPILFPWTGKLPGGTFEAKGKTYIIKEFGDNEFENMVYINCYKNKQTA